MGAVKMISVIIPVYNAEAYLRDCLDSVVNQTYRNLEIVLVDDGSSDKSPEICREYAQRDSRVRLITQNNSGSAAARCTGFRVCTGDFVMFMDADDMLYPGICKRTVDVIRNCDVLMFAHKMGCHFQSENGSMVNRMEPQYLDGHYQEKLLVSLIGPERKIPWDINLNTVWGKLYRREFLATEWFERVAGVMIGEDMLLNLQVLLKRPKVCILTEVGYFYRENPTSVVHRYLPHIRESNSRMQNVLRQILEEAGMWDFMRSGAAYQQVYGILQIFSRDIFHPDNPKTDKEKRAAFVKLADSKEFQRQIDRSIKHFGVVTRCKLILAKYRLYIPMKLLFLIWDYIKKFVGR